MPLPFAWAGTTNLRAAWVALSQNGHKETWEGRTNCWPLGSPWPEMVTRKLAHPTRPDKRTHGCAIHNARSTPQNIFVSNMSLLAQNGGET